MTTMLDELVARDVGFAKEALQKGSSQVAAGVRKSMLSMSHNMHYRNVNGKRKMYKGSSRVLGTRSDPKTGAILDPNNMSSQIHFYVPEGESRTAVVGGAHKGFQPVEYKFGKIAGNYGDYQEAVGTRGRAILHKLNTGEISSEHPYSGDSWWDNFNFVKNRNFYAKGFNNSIGAANRSIEKTYGESFNKTIANLPIKPIKRKIV